jgi:hypothetical protein
MMSLGFLRETLQRYMADPELLAGVKLKLQNQNS